LSHVATIDLAVTDLDALEAAANKLGLEMIRGQKTYRWWGHSVGDYPLPAGFTANELGKCESALRVKNNPGAYEIGIVGRRDGEPGVVLLWDFYSGGYGLQEKVGEGACKLQQEYAVEVAKKYWLGQGWQVTEDRKEDGTVQLNAVQF
jgi:hypothetical protein